MKKVVININNCTFTSDFQNALNGLLNDGDHLIVIYNLSSPKIEQKPLIGDLHELRCKKIKDKIDNWLLFISKSITKDVLVVSNHINLQELDKLFKRNSLSNVVLYGNEEQLEYLSVALKPLCKTYDFDYKTYDLVNKVG